MTWAIHCPPIHHPTVTSCYSPHARNCGTGGACAAIDYLLTPDSEQGCSLEVTDNDGNTAWHVAAEGGHLEAVQCLLKEGASMESTNAAGCTALHIAARCGQSLPIHLLFPMRLNVSCSYVYKLWLHCYPSYDDYFLYSPLFTNWHLHLLL